MKECHESVKFSVLVNGSPTAKFAMERGLRQEDPLSPFLFILAAESLNVMMEESVTQGLFLPMVVGNNNVNLLHLQFVDDATFYDEWSTENARSFLEILQCFELASGLKLNLNKTKVLGVRVQMESVTSLAIATGCSAATLLFTYLGLSVGLNMCRRKSWEHVVQNIEKRLSTWKANALSIGGQLTLINSVLGSLPLYHFSVFRAPITVVKKIRSSRNKFVWRVSGEQKKIVWARIEKFFADSERGALRVPDLRAKNLGLVHKWKWRWLMEELSLWASIVASTNGGHPGCLRFERRSNSWSVWSDIGKTSGEVENVGPIFSNLLMKEVRSGNNTRFWEDA